MTSRIRDALLSHGIQPSAQRLAVAEVVLDTDRHPSADEVHEAARHKLATLSRATVYNTLNLFVEKGLLRALTVTSGRVVFDPLTTPHHHFIDEVTGRIYDLPWNALDVRHIEALEGFEVHDYQVVIRGRRRGSTHARPSTGRGERGSSSTSPSSKR
jgi:Fur family iron response transcriptional regulator